VELRKGESIDNALTRFHKLCEEDVEEIKKRRYYEKPSDIRRKQRTRRKGRRAQ
jgi:ribosomal protein S21